MTSASSDISAKGCLSESLHDRRISRCVKSCIRLRHNYEHLKEVEKSLLLKANYSSLSLLLYRVQLVDQHAHVLAVVDGHHDEMHAAFAEGGFQHGRQFRGLADARALGAVGLRIGDEIGVAELEAEVRKVVDFLFPADHAVSAILQHQHDEVELEPHRRFQLLRIHH